MKKKKGIIINLIIIAFSLLVYMTITGGAFTSEKAHKKQELTINYGPSEIVAVVEKGTSRFILGQFNGYYSCSMVERGFLGLWYGGKKGMWGIKNDQDKPINHNQFFVRPDDSSFGEVYVYGVINDKSIKKIEIELLLEDVDSKVQRESIEITGPDQIFGDMFFSTIETNDMMYIVSEKRIAASDQNGQLIYEDIYPNASIVEERLAK
ncbi:MAG: hypothetical protein JM58_05550 [Peptococcaceae bacterium BICA1-8]|nr:MAG: hypothetical protein JM58_05550 [Peptococcaceae bacterium BICA1-8]